MNPPEYPGYGSACNGCGECCKDRPCPVSAQFYLWENDKCKALAWRAGSYWCDVITFPERLEEARIDAVGIRGICGAKMKDDK